MSDRSTGQAPARLTAVLGPTNTGKTHLAVERMCGHASGMIGLPLRLLAREIYDRVVALKGPREVALITGEEKIVPPRANYFVCTVEAMPLGREVEFMAVDEIQLCADPERGHVFTHRLLHARGKHETMLLGAGTMAPLIRRLLPKAEIVTRERFSALTYAGPKKLTRLPRRSAVVAFSADQVYGIAELIRRQRGGAAVVMGSLSPRTRNAQVALYQSGEVDFLVATDAIGMGLNMDVDHVAFAGLRKFDGRRTRWLHATEIGQIAGRAGRYRRDGTFGVTGDCEDMDEDLIERVENHQFEPITTAEWRNSRLDFDNLPALIRSLTESPQREGLRLAREALDETALKRLAEDADVAHRARARPQLEKLWEVCQTPDFRKVASDDHLGLLRRIFMELTAGRRRIPDDWMAGQFATLDRTDGEIDALAQRLAAVRTLSYVANRPDWLHDPTFWQGTMRGLEERLSDTLHEKLMARFVDRRTSVLMRQLGDREVMLAGVAEDGEVTVEGHFVGRLTGVVFDQPRGITSLEDKALRGAAQRAVAPEVARRLGALAADEDEGFALSPDGLVLWRGAGAGRLDGAGKVRLLGELGPAPIRERAQRRLEAWLAHERARKLSPLAALEAAMREGGLRGLARGLAHRLLENGGVLPRRQVEEEMRVLSQAERRALRGLGVRIGAFSLHLPGLLSDEARGFAQSLSSDPTAPPPGVVTRLHPGPVDAKALSARGLMAVGGLAVPVDQLERLDEALRAAPRQNNATVVSNTLFEGLGWSAKDGADILRGLGFTPANRGQPTAWRRRGQ
ncbi:phosphonate-binding protein, partial [Caulobacter sp. SLTY]|uniref:helicase-related protein n=1 Tax=Caulobacter sp. SLTY TaxID=2683262 RepID=UPI001412FD4B